MGLVKTVTLWDPLPEWKDKLRERHGAVFSLEPETGAVFYLVAERVRVGPVPEVVRAALARWNQEFSPAYGKRSEAFAAEQTLLAQMLTRPRAYDLQALSDPAILSLGDAALYALSMPRWMGQGSPEKLKRRIRDFASALRRVRASALLRGGEELLAVDALAPVLAAGLGGFGVEAVYIHEGSEGVPEPPSYMQVLLAKYDYARGEQRDRPSQQRDHSPDRSGLARD